MILVNAIGRWYLGKISNNGSKGTKLIDVFKILTFFSY